MPLSAWLQAPSRVWERIRGSEPIRPWIVPSAIGFLEAAIKPSWSVLEFGSGRSTLWFARRASSVVSLEHDRAWYEFVRTRLENSASTNCELRRVDLETFPVHASRLPDESMDLVFIDCLEHLLTERIDCLRASIGKVRPGGLIVLDDSDYPRYALADELTVGWRTSRFVGLRSFPLMASETTVFRCPP